MSLIWDRSGRVSAWLASSEGPSYIPVGVRIPEDVRLAITDPVVGRELWAKAAAEGVRPVGGAGLATPRSAMRQRRDLGCWRSA